MSLTLNAQQDFMSATRAVTEIEYETVLGCNHSYLQQATQAFEIDDLIYNRVYTFEITDPDDLDNLDDIQFEGYSQDWYIVVNNGQYQQWRWEGDNGESDFINVDVYIDDYSNVELGLTQEFVISAAYQVGTNVYIDTATSSIEIITSSEIAGSFLDCSNPVQFDLEDKSQHGTATWVIKQSGSTKASGSGVTASASNINTGSGEVTFTVSFGCGLDPLTFTKDFWFGKFENTIVTGTGGVCPSSLYMYTANVPGGHESSYSYTWTYPNNWTKYSQYNNFVHLYTPSNPNYGTVRVAVTNSCGTSGYNGITVYPGYCGSYYLMSPNPGTTYIDLNVDTQKTSALRELTDNNISITIVDKMGTKVFANQVTSLPFRLDISKFQKGEYIATILTTSKITTNQYQRIESIKFIVE